MRTIRHVITLSITTSIVAGCGSVSLKGFTEAGESTQSETGESAESGENGPMGETPRDPDLEETVFVGLTEKENKRHARIAKGELRNGPIARLFAKGELFAELEPICGVKIWDQCEVGFHMNGNDLGWRQWAFRRKGEKKVYWYPDMFFDKAEPKWAELTAEYILKSGDNAKTLLVMTQDKCGKPLNTRCTVRARGTSSGYVLTVREGAAKGEVIEIMQTLNEWRADL